MSKKNQEKSEEKPLRKVSQNSKNDKKEKKSNRPSSGQSNNKFDSLFTPKKNFFNKYNRIYNSRKFSRDSSNLSTSNEDFSEHDIPSQKFQGNTNFKGKASDFKIKFKTELCKYYEATGKCKYGENCAFAHGQENLRSKVTNTTAYRTKKCIQFFENGYCPYGSRCQFQHQLKNNIVNNPYDKGMSYQKMLEIISKPENIRNIKKLVEKPRLEIFKEITGENKDNKSRLLEDIKKLLDEEEEEYYDSLMI